MASWTSRKITFHQKQQQQRRVNPVGLVPHNIANKLHADGWRVSDLPFGLNLLVTDEISKERESCNIVNYCDATFNNVEKEQLTVNVTLCCKWTRSRCRFVGFVSSCQFWSPSFWLRMESVGHWSSSTPIPNTSLREKKEKKKNDDKFRTKLVVKEHRVCRRVIVTTYGKLRISCRFTLPYSHFISGLTSTSISQGELRWAMICTLISPRFCLKWVQTTRNYFHFKQRNNIYLWSTSVT